jgi:hypothetical protein
MNTTTIKQSVVKSPRRKRIYYLQIQTINNTFRKQYMQKHYAGRENLTIRR